MPYLKDFTKVCEKCVNRKQCFEFHWCITMDGKNTFLGKTTCDNFKPKRKGNKNETNEN